jgi:hypothetical protein
MAMQGSVSDESGVRTDVVQSIADTEDDDDDDEKYRKRREGSLRREFWISAASLMNKNINSKSHDINTTQLSV